MGLWWQLPIEYVVLVIDDFESYSNEVGERVFETWIDGIGLVWPNTGNGTGAAVGHDIWSVDSPHYGGTIMETDNVHGGEQSMPLYYDDRCAPYYSEAERTFRTPFYLYGKLTPQDWTVDEADTLTFYFRGEADNDPDPLYVAISDSSGYYARVTHPDEEAVLATEWQSWHIPLAELQAAGVDIASVREMRIGVGDWDNPPLGGLGLFYIDDIWVTKRMP